MRLFRNEEEDFDDSAAFDSDSGAVLKKVLGIIVVAIILIFISWLGYNQYNEWKNSTNETLNGTVNETDGINIINDSVLPEGKVVINFTDFNLTVDENPSGLYYYTTQEKVTGERCYIDGKKKNCGSLTNSVCDKKECTKDLITVTECFVNNKKINCPSD